MKPYYESNGVQIFLGDCREIMPQLEPVHAIITDPPYGLEFMGKDWDAPWKTDRRQNFDGTLQDQRENPYGRSKVRNGTGASYGADAKIMQAFQAWCETWAVECLKVLRPGGHLLSFGGSRTYHRMACAIEDAGFEIRDQIMWLYGSGFPKSLSVSAAIDKAAGAVRPVIGTNERGSGAHQIKLDNHGKGDTGIGYMDGSGKTFNLTAPATDAAKKWQGYGSALKPAHEPIVVARKPLEGTVAANVLKWGTGAVNIDGCRVGVGVVSTHSRGKNEAFPKRPGETTVAESGRTQDQREGIDYSERLGRWPANVITDGSEEVVSLFPVSESVKLNCVQQPREPQSKGAERERIRIDEGYEDSGSAARFFYTAKADRKERDMNCDGLPKKPLLWSSGEQNPGSFQAEGTDRSARNNHPTVKPLDLMAYLCKLLCPPSGGILLDPFMGSGSTIIAGRRFYSLCIGIELEEKYAEIAAKRLSQEVLTFE